jgi:mercuric ion binding protein
MNKLVSVSILLSSLLMFGNAMATPNEDVTSTFAAQGMSKKVFSIEKMTCKMCHITVRKAMEKVEGVVKAVVDYDTKTATVVFDPKKASIEAIALASTNIGYPATVKTSK